MGSSLWLRNRYWLFRSLYDDYSGRHTRVGYGLAMFLWLPHYWFGVHLNRSYEEYHSHVVYEFEYSSRRNRVLQNLVYEQFDMHVQQWIKAREKYPSEQTAQSQEPPQEEQVQDE